MMQTTNANPDEEYVIKRAKLALEGDPVNAKTWMLTAKTLYPNNFSVQFEAYKIEKSVGHIREAAKCFSYLIEKFQQQPEFWSEINELTQALRAESDAVEADKQFLCNMFKHMHLNVQHKLLLLTANHCEDPQEHCKLLLLLLQRFPTSIVTHAPGLIETLLTAEKHEVSNQSHLNSYRKLLVCDLLPLLNTQNSNLKLQPKLSLILLHKVLEYHLSILNEALTKSADDHKMHEQWMKLFEVVFFIGKQLDWDETLLSFWPVWSKESYWQKLVLYVQNNSHSTDGKDIVYCLTLFLLYCGYQYTKSLNSTDGCVLVEAFVDAILPSPHENTSRRKSEVDVLTPFITSEGHSMTKVMSIFSLTVNCWDLLQSNEILQTEFLKIGAVLPIETWTNSFLIDYYVYRGKHEEVVKKLEFDRNISPLNKHLLLAQSNYFLSKFKTCYDHIYELMAILPTSNSCVISNQLVIGGRQRHLHFLPTTYPAIMQYCCKLLVRCVRHNNIRTDLSLGHCMVLIQIDWPQEEDVLTSIMEDIEGSRSFFYPLFQTYVIQPDILEEIAYLWTSQSNPIGSPGLGQFTLEIAPNMLTRRIGTRGADKGMKEEVKLALRRQIARCNENVIELLQRFIVQERAQIQQVL